MQMAVIYFGYPKIVFVSLISESVCQTGSGYNCITYISEWLHISNVKRHIKLPTKSIIVERYLVIMTHALVLTVWRRHCHILQFTAHKILTVQNVSTSHWLLINSKIHSAPIINISNILRMVHSSTLYLNR